MFARSETARDIEHLGDADLVRLLKRGHDEALEVLLRRHRDALYRFCCHLMPNREDAEDICQETLARAITRVDSLHAGAAFRSWLFSIARNLSVDSYRSKKRTCPMPDEDSMPLPLYGETPHDRIEVSEEHQTVTEALGKLAHSHQKVLMLREVDGLSYAAIAEEMQVSQSAVETLLFRARRRLREEYTKTAVPVVALLGGLREMALRFLPPLLGSSEVAKVAITTALVGGTVASAPHVLSTTHAKHVAARPAHSVSVSHHVPALPVVPQAPSSSIASIASAASVPARSTSSAPAVQHTVRHYVRSSRPSGTHTSRRQTTPPMPPQAPQSARLSGAARISKVPSSAPPPAPKAVAAAAYAVTKSDVPAPQSAPATAAPSARGPVPQKAAVPQAPASAPSVRVVAVPTNAPAQPAQNGNGNRGNAYGRTKNSNPVVPAPAPKAPAVVAAPAPAPQTGTPKQNNGRKEQAPGQQVQVQAAVPPASRAVAAPSPIAVPTAAAPVPAAPPATSQGQGNDGNAYGRTKSSSQNSTAQSPGKSAGSNGKGH